jgi:UPF0755 protein
MEPKAWTDGNVQLLSSLPSRIEIVKRLIARLILLAIPVAAVYTAWLLVAPLGITGSGQVLELPAHAGTWEIARELRNAGVIRSAVAFEAWHLLHLHRKLKAGAYLFDSRSSTIVVFNRIARGDVFTYALTIPEGYNRFDIAQALEQAGIMPAADFIRASADPALVRDLDPRARSLEGYLFPDTYRIAPKAEPHQITAIMVKRFREAVRSEAGNLFDGDGRWVGSPTEAHPATIHDWITMASLVEKESALPSERAVIAGLFYNRLTHGMPLQCDPTVIYSEELDRRYTGTLRHADLTYNSPYNTYVHAGLPPGPIANPGRVSLRAAAHPASTPYLYFVSNGHGAHRFARTLEEHDHNVGLYHREAQRTRVP